MTAFADDEESEDVPLTRPAEFPDFQFYEATEEARDDGETCEAMECRGLATHRARSLLGAVGFWLCDQHAEWLRRELDIRREA